MRNLTRGFEMRLLVAIGLPVLVLVAAILMSVTAAWLQTFEAGRLLMMAVCAAVLAWLAWIGWHYKDGA